jgi:DNA-binding GntR family transcriptional regulator
VEGSGNPFLIESLRRVNAMRRLLEYRIHRNRDWLVKVCEEHLQLLDLIESGDLQAASDFLRKHLQDSRTTKTSLATTSL